MRGDIVSVTIYAISPHGYSEWTTYNDCPHPVYAKLGEMLDSRTDVIWVTRLEGAKARELHASVEKALGKQCDYSAGMVPDYIIKYEYIESGHEYVMLSFKCRDAIRVSSKTDTLKKILVQPFCYDEGLLRQFEMLSPSCGG